MKGEEAMYFMIGAVVAVVVTVVMRILFSVARKSPAVTTGEGTMVLKYPGLIPGIGYFSMGFGALIGLVCIFHLVPTTGDEVAPFLVLFFVLLGLPLVILGHGVRWLLSDEKIRYEGLFRRAKEIRWEEVRKVAFSLTAELVLESESAKIKLNYLLAGFPSFVEVMKRKLDPSLYEAAMQKLEKARRNIGGR